MRRLAAVTLAALCAVSGSSHAASSGGFVVFLSAPGRIIAQWQGSVRASGSVTIAYHGDQASGCAAHGLCTVSGTATWTPERTGAAALLETRRHGRIVWVPVLSLQETDAQPTLTIVTHRVRTDGSQASCLDASSNPPDLLNAGSGAHSLAIALLGNSFEPTFLAGRCAGPSTATVGKAVPKLIVTPAQLRRGTVLRFVGSHDFSAAGLAGTVTSSLVLHVGRMRRDAQSQSPHLPGVKNVKRTLRELDVDYRVVHVSGSLGATLRGAPSGSCELLDSCDTTGTVSLTPGADRATASLNAISETRGVHFRDLRHALGLARGGAASGVHPSGSISLQAGTLTQSLQRSDGSSCTDRASRIPLLIGIAFGKATVTAVATNSLSSSLRTGCPGPVFDVDTLASGTIARRATARRQFTLRLTHHRSLQDDGWFARTTGALVITLRRGRIRQSTAPFTEPAL
jgi:hypothetical protein